jgi:hypothetical protein
MSDKLLLGQIQDAQRVWRRRGVEYLERIVRSLLDDEDVA